MNKTILKAMTLGTIAFNAGRPSVACLDVDFMSLITTACIDVSTIHLAQAWHRAWNDAEQVAK